MNVPLANVPLQNLEEAASVASEFIASLDNLPNEVQHLLHEIKLKESRCKELQHEIEKDQTRYIRHSLKQNSNPASSAATPGATTNGGGNGGGPKAHLPARIAAAYSELHALSGQKSVLAQRIVDLLARKRARLDLDLARVRTLQGEPPEDTLAPVHFKTPSAGIIERSDAFGTNIPVAKINDSLRHAITSKSIIDAGAAPSASVAGSHKRRRLATATSTKIPSPAPVTPATSKAQSRSRVSRQTKQQRVKEDEMVTDVGAEEVGEEDAEDDTTPYCFCRKQSYGDMIGCDNPDCPYQWFHLSCVGVKQPLPDKWYCPECTARGAGNPERRKGRKK